MQQTSHGFLDTAAKKFKHTFLQRSNKYVGGTTALIVQAQSNNDQPFCSSTYRCGSSFGGHEPRYVSETVHTVP